MYARVSYNAIFQVMKFRTHFSPPFDFDKSVSCSSGQCFNNFGLKNHKEF